MGNVEYFWKLICNHIANVLYVCQGYCDSEWALMEQNIEFAAELINWMSSLKISM